MLELVMLHFEAEVVEGGQLPRFIGPTLRGAIGLRLRKITCVTHLPECQGCILRFQCPYCRIFEPFLPEGHKFARRLSSMPRPFALRVPKPSDKPIELKCGDSLNFSMTFLRAMEPIFPYLAIALQQALSSGIGKGVKAKLKLITAGYQSGDVVIFSPEDGILRSSLPSVSVEEVMGQPPSSLRRLRVSFITPTRIDIGGKLQNPVTFSALIKAANERGRALFWAYEGCEPPWDGKALVRSSESVKIEENSQIWHDYSRFSRRQMERLKIGGVVGSTVYEGDEMGKFLPILRLMELLNVGKLTSMGLGQIAVEAI